MFSFDVSPILFKLGVVEIRYYGLVYVFGVLLVYHYLKKKSDLSQKKIERLLFYLVSGMFLGARIFGLGPVLIKDPLALFKVWEGGMSFFGGFLGGLLGSYYVLKKKILEIGDLVVVPVSFALILGRLSNFINQELVGRVTDVSWCFEFVNHIGCRHPYQLYSAISHLVLFLILYSWSRKEYKKGELFFGFVLGYGVLRFITDFFRENIIIYGLTGWQYFSVLFIVVGILFLKRIRDNNNNKY